MVCTEGEACVLGFQVMVQSPAGRPLLTGGERGPEHQHCRTRRSRGHTLAHPFPLTPSKAGLRPEEFRVTQVSVTELGLEAGSPVPRQCSVHPLFEMQKRRGTPSPPLTFPWGTDTDSSREGSGMQQEVCQRRWAANSSLQGFKGRVKWG